MLKKGADASEIPNNPDRGRNADRRSAENAAWLLATFTLPPDEIHRLQRLGLLEDFTYGRLLSALQQGGFLSFFWRFFGADRLALFLHACQNPCPVPG